MGQMRVRGTHAAGPRAARRGNGGARGGTTHDDALERLVVYVTAELDRDRMLMDVLDDVAVAALTDGRKALLGELACDRRLHRALQVQRERRDDDGTAGQPALLVRRPRDPRRAGAPLALAA